MIAPRNPSIIRNGAVMTPNHCPKPERACPWTPDLMMQFGGIRESVETVRTDGQTIFEKLDKMENEMSQTRLELSQVNSLLQAHIKLHDTKPRPPETGLRISYRAVAAITSVIGSIAAAGGALIAKFIEHHATK